MKDTRNPDETEPGYEYTTIEHSHPNPAFRSPGRASIILDMGGHEIVAGASVEVG